MNIVVSASWIREVATRTHTDEHQNSESDRDVVVKSLT
jgi:hypothetical protein